MVTMPYFEHVYHTKEHGFYLCTANFSSAKSMKMFCLADWDFIRDFRNLMQGHLPVRVICRWVLNPLKFYYVDPFFEGFYYYQLQG